MEFIKLILKLLKGATSPFKGGDAHGNLPSPRVNIKFEDIIYDEENEELTFCNIEPEIKIGTVQNTNSMEPMIDVGHITVRSNNRKYMDDLNVGDVIIWNINRGDIIHSIIEIGNDGEWYCRTQGLNVNSPDPELIRRKHIKDVVLLIAWSKKKGSYAADEGD